MTSPLQDRNSLETGSGEATVPVMAGAVGEGATTGLAMSPVIWVIDDDETVLALAEAILVDEGLAVRCFTDARQALRACEERMPDLVVSDVMLPGMSGFEFCARLRGMAGGEDIPVLMMTSLENPDSVSRAYEAGATDFTSKPLNWAVEFHRVRYMLRVAEVTKRLRVKEREARQAQRDWERTFHAIPDIVTVLDREFRIVRANSVAARLSSKPIESLVGRRCYEVFQGATTPCAHCPVAETMGTGQSATVEMGYKLAGTAWQVAASPVTDTEGRVNHVVHIARDLSNQKKLEAEYRQAQKMEAIGTLAGGIAHDFNNLLQAIMGCADMISADNEEAQRDNGAVEIIQEAARRGSGLTRQLLMFSRRGQEKTDLRTVQLNALVKELVRMLGRMLPKTVEVTTQLAEDLGAVEADPGLIHQVLMNLAVNAWHAMPQGGRLTLETRNEVVTAEAAKGHAGLPPGEYVRIEVTDTGHGMDRKTLERIYEPFFTTKGVGQGTGLGLSVVFGIIQEHRGHIQCASELGVGTTFRIYLPLVRAAEGEAVKVLAPVKVKGTERILVVDDEAPIRNTLRTYLGRRGYGVMDAADGPSAVKAYGEARPRPDLVILDVGMPGMSGWECLRQLRALDPGVRVLITTGYGGEDVERQARESGAVGLTHKPYNLPVLANTLRSLLDGVGGAGSGGGGEVTVAMGKADSTD